MGTDDDATAARAGADGEAWFRRWFGPEYLALYPHRDREEAERGVDLFLREAGADASARLLDVGCGAGRHLRAFRARGVDAYGLDLSRPLLRRADASAGASSRLVQGDMRRLPLATGGFGAATSYFTSFGYFDSPAGDRRVLDEIRRVLRGGGWYLLDFLNAEHVRETLVPREEDTVDGRTVVQTRDIRDGAVVKRIEIRPPDGRDAAKVFHERVRLYEPGELVSLLAEASLPVAARFGDYDGSAHREDSPRFIAIGRAA